MSEWVVFTLGGLEVFNQIFNGIALLTGSDHYTTFIRLFVFFGLVYVLVEISFKQAITPGVHWLLGVFLFYNVLLVPKVTVLLEDTMTDAQRVVANVPLGIAIPASLLTRTGVALTRGIEKVMYVPGDLSYERTGMVMGSQLIAASSQFHLTNGEFSRNLENFIHQCVFYDLLLKKYSIQDLNIANDVWAFVSQHASPARAFTLDGQVVSCRDGIEALNTQWKTELKHAQAIYGARFFNDHDPTHAKQLFNTYLPMSYQYLTQLSLTTDKLLQQNMMANHLQKAVLSNASKLDATASIQEFANLRTLMQMRSQFQISGNQVGYWLPLMKTVLEALLFGAFLVVFPLLFLPQGVAIFKHYLVVLFSLSLWGALFAILNMIFNLYAQSRGVSMVNNPFGANGLNLSVLPGLARIQGDTAIVAGYISWSIPLLAYALVNRAAYAFAQIAGSLSGAAMSAAGAATQEITTGNYSFGNAHLGNSQIQNSSRYHVDHNASVQTGMTSYTDATGGVQTMTPDGRITFSAASGISHLRSQMDIAGSVETQLQRAYDTSISGALNAAKGMTLAHASVLRSASEYAESVSHGQLSDSTYATGESAQIDKAATTMAQSAKELADSHNISITEAERMLAFTDSNRHLSFGFGVGKIPIVDKLPVSFKGGYEKRWGEQVSTMDEATLQNALHEAERIVSSDDYRQAKSVLERSSFDESFRASNESAQRFADTVSQANEKLFSSRDDVSSQLNLASTAQQRLSDVQTHRASYSVNFEQRYYEWLSEQTANGQPLGVSGANHIITSDPATNQLYMQAFSQEMADGLLSSRDVADAAQAIQGFHANTSDDLIEPLSASVHKSMSMKSINEVEAMSQGGFDRRRANIDETIRTTGQSIEDVSDKLDMQQMSLSHKHKEASKRADNMGMSQKAKVIKKLKSLKDENNKH